MDLGQGADRVEPVERLRGDDRVDRARGQGDGLGRPVDDLDARRRRRSPRRASCACPALARGRRSAPRSARGASSTCRCRPRARARSVPAEDRAARRSRPRRLGVRAGRGRKVGAASSAGGGGVDGVGHRAILGQRGVDGIVHRVDRRMRHLPDAGSGTRTRDRGPGRPKARPRRAAVTERGGRRRAGAPGLPSRPRSARRAGRRSPRRGPLTVTSRVIRSTNAGDRTRTPSSSPRRRIARPKRRTSSARLHRPPPARRSRVYPASSASAGTPARPGQVDPDRRQPDVPAGRGIERRRAHAQRVEDVRAEQLVERPAETAAERLGEEVEGRRRVSEGGSGRRLLGHGQRLAQQLGAVAATHQHPLDVGVAEPGGVRQHVPRGERQEPGTVEAREPAGDRLGEVEPAGFDLVQDRGRHHRLGHRGEEADRVDAHPGTVERAERFEPDHAVGVGHADRHERHGVVRHLRGGERERGLQRAGRESAGGLRGHRRNHSGRCA